MAADPVQVLRDEIESMQIAPIQQLVVAELRAEHGQLTTTEMELIEAAAGATAVRIFEALKTALRVAT